jgi:two-component system, NarL family, sensor histidine kinase BarA
MQFQNHRQKLKILVIDAKNDLSRAIVRASQKAEIELEKLTEVTLQQAIELLAGESFDCIFWVIDYELLSSDRIKQIKQNNTKTPLVIIGENIAEERAIELLKNEAIDCLSGEDISSKNLIRCLYRAMELQTIERDINNNHDSDLNNDDENKKNEDRLYFLAQVSVLLSGFDRHKKNLKTIAWLAVPILADWCTIEILEQNDESINRPYYSTIAISHRDLSQEKLVRQLQRKYSLIQVNKERQKQLWYRTQIDDNFDISETRLKALAEDEVHLDLLQKLKLKSYLFVTIAMGTQIVGSILLGFGSSERIYNKTDLYLIEEIAIRIAGNIERAKLDREAKEINENLRNAATILHSQKQQLQTLQKLNSLLNKRLTNRAELLQVMANAVCEAIDRAQICSIVLYDVETQEQSLTVTAGSGKDKLNLSDSFIEQKVCWQQILLEGSDRILYRDPAEQQDSTHLPIVIYAVEIESVKSGKLGVLAIGSWDNVFAFTLEDKKLLGAVSEQAAIAIDNAKSIEMLEEQYQTLTQQNQKLEIQQQNIEQKNKKLLEATQLKSQFLATMSHELRTPMNAIMGFSQYLLLTSQGSLTPKQKQSIEKILSNSKNLLSLINDILAFSKIEAERLEQKLEKIDLEKLITTIISELLPLIDRSKVVIEFNCLLTDKIIVNDRSQLRRIIVNLIDNAIKFTDAGKVMISLQEVTDDRFEIIVCDTGIGIANEQLERIFEAFRQVDQSSTRRYSGTGLGLAITQSLVKLMRGKIIVESELGLGTTFRVILPKISH